MSDSNNGGITTPPKTFPEVDLWLDWQCSMISDVNSGAVYLTTKNDTNRPMPLALWPITNKASSTQQTIALKVIKGGAGVAQKEVSDDAKVLDYVAYPLLEKDRVIGAVVLALEIRSDEQRQAVLQLLQWGATWAEKALERAHNDRLRTSTLALSAVALFSSNEPLAVSGYNFCNFLADHFGCSRVILGLRKGLQVQIISMSHQLQFDRRINRVSQIEFAMEECIEHGKSIHIPNKTNNGVGSPHIHTQQLLNDNNGSVFSSPLLQGETQVGVLTLFNDKNNGFDNTVIDQISAINEHLAPIISLRQNNNHRSWKSKERANQKLSAISHLRFKVTTIASIIVLMLLTLVQTEQLVSAKATIEGSTQQSIVAPFSSYIATANSRAGDSVKQGQVIATLDDRDLLLEQQKRLSERAKHSKEYQEALATRNRAQVSMLSARMAQTDAHLNQIKQQLQHTQLLAPFDGLLVSGDWNRALGAPVERGQLLFEIVPAGSYQVALEVDEHDIAELSSKQLGKLRLAGLPAQLIQLEISRILPVASVTQGSNNFHVEADITQEPSGLRPGMQGVAKIVTGRASVLSVWTKSLTNRLRLWAWSLGL